MKKQFLVDKHTKKVKAYGDGKAVYTAKNCDTIPLTITTEEYEKLSKGYSAKVVNKKLELTKTQAVIDKEQEIQRKAELREKALEGKLNNKEMQEAIAKLI